MSRIDVVNGAVTEGAPLKREMGLPSATALVVGNMIGSGIFLLPASLAVVALAFWTVCGAPGDTGLEL